MSGFLATSPYGSSRYHRWDCERRACGGAGGLGADREQVRDAARAHVEQSGHVVTVVDGTTESLYPVATAAENEVRS